MSQSLNTVLNLAYIYLNYGKTKRAIDYLLIANRLSPNNIQVMKMQVAAFRDIKAFDQALQVIDVLEKREDVRELDRVTLLLMKSFCLKGQGKFEEAKVIFNDYLKLRRALAKKKFLEKKRRAENINAKIQVPRFTVEDDMETFVSKGYNTKAIQFQTQKTSGNMHH